jgi:hypothetical protein
MVHTAQHTAHSTPVITPHSPLEEDVVPHLVREVLRLDGGGVLAVHVVVLLMSEE